LSAARAVHVSRRPAHSEFPRRRHFLPTCPRRFARKQSAVGAQWHVATFKGHAGRALPYRQLLLDMPLWRNSKPIAHHDEGRSHHRCPAGCDHHRMHSGAGPGPRARRATYLQLSPHAFIKPLLDSQDIDPMPMRVEANSVNAFRPTHDSHLTAFGYRVYAVVGYEEGDSIFQQGSDKPIAKSGYGVVVFGPSDTVKARLREAGSDATVREVVPLLITAVFCSRP